jgi:hypothetical protein
MNSFKYHNALNSRNNQRFNPYKKFVSIPSKVIPSDTTFKTNSEILITKIGAKCDYPTQKQEYMQNNFDNKENMESKKQKSVLKASEWVQQTTNENACKLIKKFKKKNCSEYKTKRVF